MAEKKCVMISSTARDLPEHRKEVMDACLRQGMFPVMMEHLPASDADAISASLKMVNEADIYVGILAYRYGYIPKNKNARQISITEMEYDHAVERKIPRLIFVMDKSHPIIADDMDIENAAKLKAFKERVQTENIVNFFKSPADLRANVINSLSQYREADITQFHFVSDIPTPPEAYIAHPYTLLQTHRLIGRQDELNLLTEWVTKKQEGIYWTRMLNIVAIGGMGKSALTWKWFNDIAPQEMKPLAGRMWWSFYESDASFENFVIRALAYVSQHPHEEIQNVSPPEREEQLLTLLDREPFLLVLDGLERILLAYARMDAARLADDDIDQRTANYVAKAYGLPESAAQSFVGQHLLRKTIDPRVGNFLRKLSAVRNSRILISTRLYPADLQSVTGEPIAGSAAVFLKGLKDKDAIELWRSFNVSGRVEVLISIFNRVDNHPLLIQTLAGQVAQYRSAPGNFEKWYAEHPDFEPQSIPAVNVKSHILRFALIGLSKPEIKTLQIIAAFRKPVSYHALQELMKGVVNNQNSEQELDAILSNLEDRGLIGWNKQTNSYDLHPIVRSVIWDNLNEQAKSDIYDELGTYFESLPKYNLEKDGLRLFKFSGEKIDLSPTIELFNTLIGRNRFLDALHLFSNSLFVPMVTELHSNEASELLQTFFEPNYELKHEFQSDMNFTPAFMFYAVSQQLCGKPGQSALLHRHSSLEIEKIVELAKQVGVEVPDTKQLKDYNYSTEALLLSGSIYDAEVNARLGLITAHGSSKEAKLFDEVRMMNWLGSILGVCGNPEGIVIVSKALIQGYVGLSIPTGSKDNSIRMPAFYDIVNSFAFLVQNQIWFNAISDDITTFADNAWDIANQTQQITDIQDILIRAARIQGIAALTLGDYSKAKERINFALSCARKVNFVQEEIQALTVLAEIEHEQRNAKAAREILDDLWELAERGPYPLFHADAFNILAKIERDAGNKSKAVDAATKAYRLAWCDGEPYAYHWGLVAARKHLKELGATEPEMPPFDKSKFEPMPEVEINPNDEFHVDENELGK